MWAFGNPPEAPRVLPQQWPAPGEARVLYVLALDPGTTSGWAALRIDYDRLIREGFRAVMLGGGVEWRAGELKGPEPFQAELFVALARGVWQEGEFAAGCDSDLFVVTIEDFILDMFSRDRELLSPVRLTAQVQALTWRTLPAPVVQFSANDAKHTVGDDQLRAFNLWVRGPDHVRDALRHAVLTARRMVETKWRAVQVARMGWLADVVDAAVGG